MGKPIVNGGANLAPLDGRLARAVMSGNQQQDAVAACDGLVESAIDRGPGAVEGQSVKVENAIRLDRTAAKPLVPGAVEGLVGDCDGLGLWRRRTRL